MVAPTDFVNLTDLPESEYLDDWAVAVESSDPAQESKHMPLSKITKKIRTDSASQLDGVYNKDYATGDVIPADAMKNKLMYWHNGQFYSVGTNTGFTSSDFDADLAAGRFVDKSILTATTAFKTNHGIIPKPLTDRFKLNINELVAGEGDDASSAIQHCFDNQIPLHGDGYYTVSSPITIPDHYVELTGNITLDSANGARVFKQLQLTETDCALQSNINISNTVCVLSDVNIPVGAIVRFVSNRLITENWTDTPIAGREYYNEGEINKVISKSGNTYTFEAEFYFNYDQSNMKSVSWYVPRGGCKIEATLKCNPSSIYSGNTGLELWQQDNNVDLKIKSIGFNSNGVILGQCWKPNIERVDSTGGDDASELNYGLNIADGTRFANVELVRGNDTRHAITIGGSGRAISLQGSITKAFNTNTNKTSVALPGIDAHGNSAGFIFGQCITDTCTDISGLDHIIESAICGDGYFTAASEGGKNIRYGDLTLKNPYKVSNGLKPIVDLFINNLNVEYTKQVSTFDSNLNVNGNTRISTLIATCKMIMNATGDTDANNKALTNPWSIRSETSIDYAKISGFPYIRLVGKNIEIGHLIEDSCNWGTQNTRGNTVEHDTDCENVIIKQLTSKETNSRLTYTGRILGVNSSQSYTFSKMTYMNFSGENSRGRVIDIPVDVENMRLINNTMVGASSIPTHATNRVWGWSGLTDA